MTAKKKKFYEDELIDKTLNGFSSIDESDYKSTKSKEELDSYIRDISESVRSNLDKSIDSLTPWFFNNMPNIYYQTTPKEEKSKHLAAIITGNIFADKQVVEIWDQNKTKVTFLGPGNSQEIVSDIGKKLKTIKPNLGSLYFSKDKLLFIATFFCENEKNSDDLINSFILEKIEQTRKISVEIVPEEEKETFENFLKELSHNTIKYATPKRLLLIYKMLHHMSNNEGAHTIIQKSNSLGEFRITIGIKGLVLSETLVQVLDLINFHKLHIIRYFVKEFKRKTNQNISIFHFVLSPQKTKEKLSTEAIHITKIKLIKAFRTLGWTDSDEYNKLGAEHNFSPNATNLIRSIASWVQIILSKENVYYYTSHKIFQTFHNQEDITILLLKLFRIKLDPREKQKGRSKSYQKSKESLSLKISKIIDKVERNIFIESLNFLDAILKTNYFVPTKTGLAFRLKPDFLNKKHYHEMPFAIFFIVGKDYRFFHVRWRDVARGGLRIIIPQTNIQYDYASSGLFDEVYGLSFAQQLKNKDIPEGGAKAVLLVKPKANQERAFKGAINALLDLLVAEDETHEKIASKIISYSEQEDILYLGPDENMTNDLIEWVQRQAIKRGYKYARAFMSSQPVDGINHKKYGVTSEGLHVYLENVMAHLNINPSKETFSVKMTGGPDGDVASNELKILHRKYKDTCKIVAVADGLGAAYDSEGLNWDEIIRLVNECKSISFFDRNKLSKAKGSFVVDINTVENLKTRNEIHSKIKADIFIPAGGRPYTVNEENVSDFVLDNNEMSCKAIVEGANIFFTDKAREFLQDRGIIMIKDSSANKTGVICSSYEIISSLVLEEKEFLEIKEEYIKEVIEILRHRAQQEATLLLNTKKIQQNKSLTDLSKELSTIINSLTDLLLFQLMSDKDKYLTDNFYNEIILRHCPPILRKDYRQKVIANLPDVYKIAIVASYCASYIVYTEGVDWISSFPQNKRFEAVTAYMKNDIIANNLILELNKSTLKDKKKIASIIKKSGAYALTNLFFKN